MPGRLSRVTYTSPTNTKVINPSAVPVRFRRMIIATNPTIAKPVIKKSSAVVSGKNMSQNESVELLGRKPYFMSVINSWPNRNGPTHQADSNSVVTPQLTAYQQRLASIQTRDKTIAPTATKIRTMPCDTAASDNTAAAHTRAPPVRSPCASNPSPNIASVRAIENEYSPAIVDLTLPP